MGKNGSHDMTVQELKDKLDKLHPSSMIFITTDNDDCWTPQMDIYPSAYPGIPIVIFRVARVHEHRNDPRAYGDQIPEEKW